MRTSNATSVQGGDYSKKFCEELIACLPFDMTLTAWKTMTPIIFCYCQNVFNEPLPNSSKGIHGQTHRLL
jgi:hypothetical protein